jgi:cell division protein FtsW
MRLALVIYLAERLNHDKGVITEFKDYLRHAGVVALAMFLIILQPDLGTALAIGMTCALMMYVAGVRIVHLAGTALSTLPFIAFIVFGLGYRKERVMTFLYPTGDVQGEGYQISQSLVALGSGGWTGLGLTQSLQKYFFLPEPHTDFVFSIVGEELGMVGTLGLLACFLLFGHLGLKVARQAPFFYGFLLASGLTFMVMVYALINIGVSTGILPTTGLPLPFISYGGSSLLLTLVATGLLINVGRTSHVAPTGILVESSVAWTRRPKSRTRTPILSGRA